MCGPPSSARCTGVSANFGSWPASSAAWPRVPGGLVVRGEAGIGKSALLAAAAGLAADSGARVLSATGIQAEARLPFAGLHQLLRPVLGYAVLPEGTARFYHRRDLRYVHVAGLDDIEVALAQHKARPMPEFDRFARIAQRLLGRVA